MEIGSRGIPKGFSITSGSKRQNGLSEQKTMEFF